VIAVGDDGTTKVLGTGGVGPTRTIAGVDLYGVSFIDSSTGWAVGDGPTVLRTDNGGATWSPAAPLPLPAPWTEADRAYLAARAVAFTGSMAGMVVGAYQTVWRTPDGGDSWTASLLYDAGTLDDYDLRGVAFTPGSIDGPVVVSRMQYLDSPDNKARAYKGAWAGLVTPTPPAPSGVILAGEGTASRQISWTDNSFTEGGFVLQRAQDSTANVAFSTVATLPANTTSWTDSPVDLGPVFYYRVKSYRGADSSAWATADVTAPTTVSNAKAVYSGSATILLTGTDNVGGSGVDHTYYRLDGGAETTYTAAFSTTKTGAHTLEFWSVDRAGNVESFHTATFTVLIATSVSITSDHTSASYGHAIVFSGHVSSNISTNSHVEVWAKKPGSSTWVKLSTRHSTSTHHWSYTYAPPAKGTWYFQVRYAGTSKYGPSTSSSRAVTVKAVATSVSITSNHTTVTSGHPVVFSGHISSNRPRNTDVKVYAKQPGSSTWVYLSTRHTTSTHHWSYTYAPTIKGTWYFQVRYAGTSKYGASTSSSRKITVN
jgi:hypothetical protein